MINSIQMRINNQYIRSISTNKRYIVQIDTNTSFPYISSTNKRVLLSQHCCWRIYAPPLHAPSFTCTVRAGGLNATRVLFSAPCCLFSTQEYRCTVIAGKVVSNGTKALLMEKIMKTAAMSIVASALLGSPSTEAFAPSFAFRGVLFFVCQSISVVSVRLKAYAGG